MNSRAGGRRSGIGVVGIAGLAGMAAGLGVGCVTVATVTVGQKTSLEQQLIGALEPLSEEELLVSSVRAGASTSVAFDDLHQRAVAARRRQAFNRDDLDALRSAGCLGEDAEARVVERSCADSAKLVDLPASQLAAEENADRTTLIEWIIAVDPILTPQDRRQVVALLARRLHGAAPQGSWIQDEAGAWSRKP